MYQRFLWQVDDPGEGTCPEPRALRPVGRKLSKHFSRCRRAPATRGSCKESECRHLRKPPSRNTSKITAISPSAAGNKVVFLATKSSPQQSPVNHIIYVSCLAVRAKSTAESCCRESSFVDSRICATSSARCFCKTDVTVSTYRSFPSRTFGVVPTHARHLLAEQQPETAQQSLGSSSQSPFPPCQWASHNAPPYPELDVLCWRSRSDCRRSS